MIIQHLKDNGNLSEIGTAFKNPYLLGGTLSRVLKSFNLNPVNKLFSWAKIKGVPAEDIFKALFLLPFIDVLNIHAPQLFGYSPSLCAKKDAFYTFLKNHGLVGGGSFVICPAIFKDSGSKSVDGARKA